MKKISKLLLVDDDRINNHLNQNLFAKLNIAEEIVIKTDGQEALQYLQCDCKAEESFPKLILLDIKMPVLDGFEFLERFQQDFNNTQDMIVVILTTSKSGDDVVRLKDLGNYYYINKPLTEEKVYDIYHRYFRNSNSSTQMA